MEVFASGDRGWQLLNVATNFGSNRRIYYSPFFVGMRHKLKKIKSPNKNSAYTIFVFY